MLVLNEDTWRILEDTQRRVNSRITYETDQSKYGVPEYWEVVRGRDTGDCDDYVLTKRAILREAFPYDHDSFRIATCWDETGAYHAVLVVDTDQGAYVLDNREHRVIPWNSLPYRWHLIQNLRGGWDLV